VIDLDTHRAAGYKIALTGGENGNKRGKFMSAYSSSRTHHSMTSFDSNNGASILSIFLLEDRVDTHGGVRLF